MKVYLPCGFCVEIDHVVGFADQFNLEDCWSILTVGFACTTPRHKAKLIAQQLRSCVGACVPYVMGTKEYI